jgi:hypothetical protein
VKYPRDVLAANKVNVIDAQIRRHDFVARRTSATGPFDDPRASPIEGLRSVEESLTIAKARPEFLLVAS